MCKERLSTSEQYAIECRVKLDREAERFKVTDEELKAMIAERIAEARERDMGYIAKAFRYFSRKKYKAKQCIITFKEIYNKER